MKVKLALIAAGGELDHKIIEVSESKHSPEDITDALLTWLTDDGHVLDVGDTLTITEVTP